MLSALKYADKFISAFDFIYKKMKKSENLLPILRNIQTTLDQLPRGLEDVKKEIHEAHMKTQLYRYERTIKDSFSYINEFATTNSTTSKNQFLEMGDDLKKAVNAILDGLLGVQHFGADILRVYREATEVYIKFHYSVLKIYSTQYEQLMCILSAIHDAFLMLPTMRGRSSKVLLISLQSITTFQRLTKLMCTLYIIESSFHSIQSACLNVFTYPQ